MMYRKYKAVGHMDRARKQPPSNGFETDSIVKMYDFLWKEREMKETFEITCRESDETFIITPEQTNDATKLFEALTEIVRECNCE